MLSLELEVDDTLPRFVPPMLRLPSLGLLVACSSILLRNRAREFLLQNVVRIVGVQSKPAACNLSVKVVSAVARRFSFSSFGTSFFIVTGLSNGGAG
jgi:hypothetical protein